MLQPVERILAATMPTVIAACENKVRKLEQEKHAIKERIAATDHPASSFDETLRTALEFVGSS